MSADTIINAAKAAWDVIKDGKASLEVSQSNANAVPDVPDWQSLAGAKGPMWIWRQKQITFVWPLEDYLHVDVQIMVKWDYGATYKGGGAYIPNVWVEVPECFVGFGWDCNIRLETRNPTNASPDGQPPVARLPVTLTGQISSGAELYRVDWGFVLYGTGKYDS